MMNNINLLFIWIMLVFSNGLVNASLDNCKDQARKECPLLFDSAHGRQVHDWNDESIWDVPKTSNHVIIPSHMDLFLSSCHLQNDQQFEQVVVPSSSHLFISDFSIRAKLGKIIGKVSLLSEEECLSAASVQVSRRMLDEPTKSPTRFPTSSPTRFPTTNSPTNFPTYSPTLSPTEESTILVTNSPTFDPLVNNNPFINGSANDAAAVATLVGTTVPFFGLGIIFAGVYMVRKRRAWSLTKNQLNGSVIVDDNNNHNSPRSKSLHVSASNPAFQVRETSSEIENAEGNDQDIEAFPAPPFAFPGMPMSGSDSNSENDLSNARASGKRKTTNSLLAMVLKSRETAAYYTSPIEKMEEGESGLSKQDIEEKVKRMAAAGARGFGTTTSGAGLKAWGMALAQMKPKERESLKPSEIAQRESVNLLNIESKVESLVFVPRTSSVPQSSAMRPITTQLGGGDVPDWRATTSTVDY